MLEMLRDLGIRVAEIDGDLLDDVCVYVKDVDLLLIRRGASEEDVATVVDWALLKRVPTERQALPDA